LVNGCVICHISNCKHYKKKNENIGQYM
jgi:hypothetical protein